MWHRLTPSHLPGLRLFHKQAGHHHLLAEGNHPDDLTSIPIRVTDDEALAFAAQLPEVRALVDHIRNMEWYGDRDEEFCLACGRIPSEGHTADCAWVAVMAPFQEATGD